MKSTVPSIQKTPTLYGSFGGEEKQDIQSNLYSMYKNKVHFITLPPPPKKITSSFSNGFKGYFCSPTISSASSTRKASNYKGCFISANKTPESYEGE